MLNSPPLSSVFLPIVRLWNDKAAWAKMRQKILDSPMSELDVVQLEKELSKVSVFACSVMCCTVRARVAVNRSGMGWGIAMMSESSASCIVTRL